MEVGLYGVQEKGWVGGGRADDVVQDYFALEVSSFLVTYQLFSGVSSKVEHFL